MASSTHVNVRARVRVRVSIRVRVRVPSRVRFRIVVKKRTWQVFVDVGGNLSYR